ncbi:tetratricopeptide repeat protein [Streptomyces sp. HNM0575]|nr:tetratricopeptide repeat protein [Streptomyces sp. HNM0575]
MSLNNLGTMLSELGRQQEALQTATEAVGICRELATQNPPADMPHLASALNNYSNRLSATGQ